MSTEIEAGGVQAKSKNAGATIVERGKEPVLPRSLWKEYGPANILIADFWPPKL